MLSRSVCVCRTVRVCVLMYCTQRIQHHFYPHFKSKYGVCAVVFIQYLYVDRYELAEWITNNHAGICAFGILRFTNISKQECVERRGKNKIKTK